MGICFCHFQKGLTAIDVSDSCTLTSSHVSNSLLELVYGATVAEIECMTMDDDLMLEFGGRDRWSFEQV